MVRKGPYVLPALAAAAYGIAAAAAAAVGFGFWIPWAIVQLLDAGELRRAPAAALLALHSQPPLLNAVLAAAMRLGTPLGCAPELLLSVLFFLLGGAVVVLLALLVEKLTGSFWLAIGAVLLTVADPALHVFRTVYFYELPLAALLLAGLAAAWRYLEHGGERHLLLFVLALGGMCLLRSLYHPLWAAGMFGLLAAGRARLAPERPARGAWWRSAALLALLLGIWPLKNALLFGAPVMSSWVGYNLSRGTPVRQPDLWSYIETGTIPEAQRQQWQRIAPAFWRDAPVLVAPVKGSGVRNWNHYAFLLTYRQLERDALAWRREHLGDWLRQSAANYLLWGRPAYLDSYWGRPRGPDDPRFKLYASWHERLLFPDFRNAVVRLTPGAKVHSYTRVWGGPAPYTPFILAGLPLLLLAVAVLLPRRLRQGPEAWVALLAAATLLWVLVVPCLTDGTEGNRMRYPVSPCVLLLGAWTAAAAWRRLPRVRRQPRPATAREVPPAGPGSWEPREDSARASGIEAGKLAESRGFGKDRDTVTMECVGGIEGGDPEICVQHEHGSATLEPPAVSSEDLGGRRPRAQSRRGFLAKPQPRFQPLLALPSLGGSDRPVRAQPRAHELGHQFLELLVPAGRRDLDLGQQVVGKLDRSLHGTILPENQLSMAWLATARDSVVVACRLRSFIKHRPGRRGPKVS